MECAPAFDYARARHYVEFRPDTTADPTTDLPPGPNTKQSVPSTTRAIFDSPNAKLTLDLRYVPEAVADDVQRPKVELKELDLTAQGHLGLSVCADMDLAEGQAVW